MDILLIHPPDEMEAMLGIGRELVQKFQPLGLLYIAAVAMEKGHDVSVVDAHVEGLTAEDIKKRILADRPDVVGFSVLTCSGGIAYELGRWIKQNVPETFVVFGNVHASIFSSAYLRNGCCDVVVHGEGEYPFLKLLDHRAGKCSLGDIPAISFLADDGRVVDTKPGAFLVDDLSKLPQPARELLDPKLYYLDTIANSLYFGQFRTSSKTMCTSRGCWYKCTFCVVNQAPRFNDAMRVVDEMEHLQKDYGAGYSLIIDPLCMYDRPRMFRICKEIRRRKLTIQWGCTARVNSMTPDLLRAMDDAGCYDLAFGIESGVQRLLNRIKKGTNIGMIERAIHMIRNNSDIKIGGLFILGLPGETYEDSLETIRFAKSLPLDMAQFSLCTPYPGSALFEELRALGQLDTGERPNGTLDVEVWKRYSAYISFTGLDPIWVTPEQTPSELRGLQKRAQREFYLRPSVIAKHVGRIRPSNVAKVAKIVWNAFI